MHDTLVDGAANPRPANATKEHASKAAHPTLKLAVSMETWGQLVAAVHAVQGPCSKGVSKL